MNSKYLVTATIVGGVVLFLWGFITHSLLPQPMSYFKDEMAVVQVLRANAAVNGIYFGPRGVFASVAMLPDLGDKTRNIVPNLLRQLCSDSFAALLLAILLTRLPGTVPVRAGWAVLAGLTAFVLKFVPYWNWYGFPSAFVGMEALDLLGKFFIGALVLGVLRNKLAPAALSTEMP
jgi:hypothetical protein